MAAPVMSCVGYEEFVQEEAGNSRWVPTDLSVEIAADKTGKYGYSALVRAEKKEFSITDVTVESVSPKDAGMVKDMAEVMVPELSWQEVAAVQVGNVGVERNLQDSSGIYIFNLISKEGATLSRLATKGWGFGRCRLAR